MRYDVVHWVAKKTKSVNIKIVDVDEMGKPTGHVETVSDSVKRRLLKDFETRAKRKPRNQIIKKGPARIIKHEKPR